MRGKEWIKKNKKTAMCGWGKWESNREMKKSRRKRRWKKKDEERSIKVSWLKIEPQNGRGKYDGEEPSENEQRRKEGTKGDTE